jgi:hypothetical protein
MKKTIIVIFITMYGIGYSQDRLKKTNTEDTLLIHDYNDDLIISKYISSDYDLLIADGVLDTSFRDVIKEWRYFTKLDPDSYSISLYIKDKKIIRLVFNDLNFGRNNIEVSYQHYNNKSIQKIVTRKEISFLK